MPEYLLTQEKKDALIAELEELKVVQRPTVLKRLDEARSLGDLKENAEYHATRDVQGRMEARIREIEELLKFVTVVEKTGSGCADLASTVVIQKTASPDSPQQKFTIVSSAEANILEGKIADVSPIGEALMGKRAGDIAQVATPGGIVEYLIIDIY